MLLATLALAGGLYAADFAALKPQAYVSDFAEVIDPASRAQIDAYCQNVEQATGAQIALVTLRSTEGEPVEEVANLLYRQWGVGKKGTNEGVLALFVINDKRTRIEVGYGLEPIIPDGYAGGILRGLNPALEGGDYAQALAVTARELGERIATAKNVVIPAAGPRLHSRPRRDGPPIGTLVIVGGLFLLFLFSRGRGMGAAYGGGVGGFVTGMIVGGLMNGGRAPRGGDGGGFGGYDSGDSFGGFGGGDSGGGGASGGW
jgi:uncharacterized protein